MQSVETTYYAQCALETLGNGSVVSCAATIQTSRSRRYSMVVQVSSVDKVSCTILLLRSPNTTDMRPTVPRPKVLIRDVITSTIKEVDRFQSIHSYIARTCTETCTEVEF